MRRIFVTSLLLAASVSLAVGCERVKSASPLSPSIAGPIAGVEITQPVATSPAEHARIAADQQPITFTVANAETNGVRPLSYQFDIAIDYEFSQKVYSQTSVAQGQGSTSFRMPQNLPAERTYYWRVKAYDGANEGLFSPPFPFTVFTPVVIGVPSPSSPGDGATLSTRVVALTVQNAPVTGPAGAITYQFEVATDSAMSNRVASAEVGAGSGSTSYTTAGLAASTRFFWRARAFDFARVGNWSAVRSFTTGAGTVVTPPPPTTNPAPNDQLDLRQVTIVSRDANITNWAVTSTVISAAHSGSDMCINHTMAGRWPQLPFFDTGAAIEGNQWFFAQIGGKWYGGANEWLRPGQVCKNVDGHIGQGGYGGTPMANWTPAPGEIVGVAVSTPARGGQTGGAERSNVVLIRW